MNWSLVFIFLAGMCVGIPIGKLLINMQMLSALKMMKDDLAIAKDIAERNITRVKLLLSHCDRIRIHISHYDLPSYIEELDRFTPIMMGWFKEDNSKEVLKR